MADINTGLNVRNVKKLAIISNVIRNDVPNFVNLDAFVIEVLFDCMQTPPDHVFGQINAVVIDIEDALNIHIGPDAKLVVIEHVTNLTVIVYAF